MIWFGTCDAMLLVTTCNGSLTEGGYKILVNELGRQAFLVEIEDN
jgi:hypothetical protein